jgi:hypothetical protein
MLQHPIATIAYSKDINIVSQDSSPLGASLDASKVHELRKSEAETAQIITTTTGQELEQPKKVLYCKSYFIRITCRKQITISS